jgi:hypothetical protein
MNLLDLLDLDCWLL